MKIDKWDKQNIKSKLASMIGEDGELYIGYEGGIPLKARELVSLYYSYWKNDRLHRWMTKIEQKEYREYYKWLKGIELKEAYGSK